MKKKKRVSISQRIRHSLEQEGFINCKDPAVLRYFFRQSYDIETAEYREAVGRLLNMVRNQRKRYEAQGKMTIIIRDSVATLTESTTDWMGEAELRKNRAISLFEPFKRIFDLLLEADPRLLPYAKQASFQFADYVNSWDRKINDMNLAQLESERRKGQLNAGNPTTISE